MPKSSKIERVILVKFLRIRVREMSKKNTKIFSGFNKKDNQMHKYQTTIISAFVVMIVAMTFFMSFVFSTRTTTTMQSKVSTLVSANNYQQVMNVDNYLKKIKDTVSLFFSEEAYYKYDETSDEYDQFEKLQIEHELQTRIQDLGVLENFSDFGVVYSDAHTLGWVSDNTYRMFPGDEMYKTFSENITDLKSESGWLATDKCDYDRIFYIKRLNENALLFTSFYTHEFDSVFVVPNDMRDMVISLVDSNNLVIYSTNENETGKPLMDSIANLVQNKHNSLVLNDDYLVTAGSCNNDAWRVVCYIPKASIMREIRQLEVFAYSISTVMAIIVIIFAFILMHTVSKPMDKFLNLLKTQANLDRLTGLLNKISFQSLVESIMNDKEKGTLDVFVMFDMDNFKNVNDTLGHAVGDNVLVRLAALIKRYYSADVITGRIGGDEFALYTRISEETDESVHKKVENSFNGFRQEFNKEFAEEIKECKLSLSAGVAVVESGEMDFETIYQSADQALYNSKRSGKDRLSYFEGKTGEENE